MIISLVFASLHLQSTESTLSQLRRITQNSKLYTTLPSQLPQTLISRSLIPLTPSASLFTRSHLTLLSALQTNTNMGLTGMMLIAVCIHFLRDPNNAGWLLVLYCLYYNIRGTGSWLSRLAIKYLDGVV
jgi:hypothetical protein